MNSLTRKIELYSDRTNTLAVRVATNDVCITVCVVSSARFLLVPSPTCKSFQKLLSLQRQNTCSVMLAVVRNP